MSQEKDKIFFRNYSIVIGILAVFLFASYILAQFVGVDEEKHIKNREELTAKMTAPAGSVSVEGVDEAPALEAVAEEDSASHGGAKSGEDLYKGMCVACHSVPGIGAPVVGNEEEWAPRIEKGVEELYANAINGYTGPEGYMMPPRGGSSYSDEEMKLAVDYMLAQSGGPAESASAGGDAVAAVDGEAVYNGMCVACHSTPALGAPVVGNAADWTPRLEKGIEMVYSNAINGFTGEKGMMPARGGGSFSDDEVKAAVDYMLSKSQ